MAEKRKGETRPVSLSRKLYRTAGVLVVGIPAQYVKELGWQAGEEVRVQLRGKEIRVWKPVITHPGR